MMNTVLNSREEALNRGKLINLDDEALASKRIANLLFLDGEAHSRVRRILTVGMDADTLSRAFQPFFSTKPDGEGTGLGLSTAQSVVRDHGGEIDIRSRVGHGTRVSVYLPASEPSRPLQAPTQRATGRPERVARLARRLGQRREVRRMLVPDGRTASAGQELPPCRSPIAPTT